MGRGALLITCKHGAACSCSIIDVLVGSVENLKLKIKKKERKKETLFGSNFVIAKNLLLITRLKKSLKVDKGKAHFDASFQDFVRQYFWRQAQLLHQLLD